MYFEIAEITKTKPKHVLSTAGEFTTGQGNRLADGNLEQGVLLKNLAIALACNHLRSALIVTVQL